MSKSALYTIAEASEMIVQGRFLLIAGDESLLSLLPPGKWIGGTTANFMAPGGGITVMDKVFIFDLTELATKAVVRAYSEQELPALPRDYTDNGFTVLLIPAFSDIHATFAREVQSYDGVFNSPLFGWVSGVHIADLGQRAAKVYAGSGVALGNQAAAMHVTLPPGQRAKIDIVNLFHPGDGDDIVFEECGFETNGSCLIGGKYANLATYLADHAVDTKLPLVADYNGALVNVSIRTSSPRTGRVEFYAPVFKGVTYRIARPVPDYIGEFTMELRRNQVSTVALSCNCLLNYVYAGLEGKKTGDIVGPASFGEIAYMLLNQTLVYLTIEKAD